MVASFALWRKYSNKNTLDQLVLSLVSHPSLVFENNSGILISALVFKTVKIREDYNESLLAGDRIAWYIIYYLYPNYYSLENSLTEIQMWMH